MTDISVFKKMLGQTYYTAADYVWLGATEIKPGSGYFIYHVGIEGWPISKLFTCSLADARAAAESFGVPVWEYGPPEAFGEAQQ